jgi:DNA repair exonuclease SbcCD ATPase subunit
MVTKVTESMDLTQAMQTLKWLDGERRKDRATIAKLEERLEEQGRRLARQSAQIDQLRSSLASVEAVLSQVDEFEQMVSNYKKEMIFQLEERDETWRKERDEAKRMRQLEHEGMKEQLNRLEKELRVLPRYDEQISARQAEEERLTEKLQSLEVTVVDSDKRLEDSARVVSYLEERRRADHRRLTEFEHEIPELNTRIDTLTQKLALFEQSMQKQQARLDEAIQELRRYDKPIEELRISDFQREQKMQQYLDQGAEVAQELERLREQTHDFIKRRQQVKRALDALEKIKTRIEGRQDEMAERQRLAEERTERQWEEWQSARAKELKKREMVIEQRWQEQERTDVKQEGRLETLEAIASLYREQLRALWEAHRADASGLLSAAQKLYEELVAPIDDQLATLRGEQ